MDRTTTVVAGIGPGGESRFVRHRLDGETSTLCGVELAGVTLSRPELGHAPVHACEVCARRNVAELAPHDERVVVAVKAALGAVGGQRTEDELEVIALAAVAAASPPGPDISKTRGTLGALRHPFELLPHEGLLLYDDERDLLAWAQRGNTDALEAVVGAARIPRRATIVGLIGNVSALRRRRLEQMAEEEEALRAAARIERATG